ncbi:uncharacterized protein LOC124113541 isoform X2 [Haliotis rufescens]|uniref:uncharacterized protein LOC124113541 isoform X2 n=1 Tax=Haliotis rufescens TaxID=6454 RepID=UPI00201EF393|nr:uncharacterized protein LOC124113541 isoform X2 [Haliotis rufescens]
MSVEAKEHFWREHQDSLRRIRTHLVSGKRSPATKTRTPVYGRRSPAARNTHPPYGKYRRATPPNLPRLDTPPEHEERRSHRNLRKTRYEEVPPVKPRKAFVNPPEYDSWGEETDDDEDDQLKPHPLPYPIYAPPNVVYGQPFPMYYPPPPKGAGRHQKRRDKKRKSDRGYKDIHRDRLRLSESTSKKKGRKSRRDPARNSVPLNNGYPIPLHSYPGPMNGYPVPMLNAYVMPVHTIAGGSDSEDDEEESEEEPVRHRRAYTPPRRSYRYVQPLLDIEPDHISPAEHPWFMPALRACDDVLTREIEEMTVEIVREAMLEEARPYTKVSLPPTPLTPYYIPPPDPLEMFLEDVVAAAVMEQCREVVRETVLELAHNYLEDVMADNILDELLAEEVQDMRNELLEEAVFDIIAEDFLEDEVIGPEVEDEAVVVAKDIIQHYDSKITRREMKSVKEMAGDRLVESLCLDYLLSLISRQGKVWTESDFANRFVDEMMGNILLRQYFGVKTNRDKTIHCKPLRKLHEKVVTDVALDVLLQQLSSSLDEDLADVDEYERGVNDGIDLPTAPAIVR